MKKGGTIIKNDNEDEDEDDEWNLDNLSDDAALNELSNVDISNQLSIRKTGNVPVSNSKRPKKSEE